MIYTILQQQSGTDITLKDRKNEYVNNTVCQDDCEFVDNDYSSQKAHSSCKVKESFFFLI